MKLQIKISGIIAFMSFFLVQSNSTTAQNNAASVKSLSDFLQTYKDKHQIILKSVEDTNLTITQKLMLYESEMGNLKEEFKVDRRAEYQSKSVKLSVAHSCTSGSHGGVKKCGYKYVLAPKNMYTRTNWVKVTGTNKGISIGSEGSFAGLNMTVAGKGTNSGTLTAIFRYKPESIAKLVDEETINLFNRIVEE
jgi:hypothetical protein